MASSTLKERLAASRIKFKKQLSSRNTRIGLALHLGTPLRDLRRAGVVSTTQSRQSLEYYRKKAADPSFHSAEWGGARRKKFSDSTVTLISVIIWHFLHVHPMATFYEVLQAVRCEGIDCRKSYLRDLFRQWKWSWKQPVVQQLVSFPSFSALSPSSPSISHQILDLNYCTHDLKLPLHLPTLYLPLSASDFNLSHCKTQFHPLSHTHSLPLHFLHLSLYLNNCETPSHTRSTTLPSTPTFFI